MTPEQEALVGRNMRNAALKEGHKGKLPENPESGITPKTKKVALMIKALCAKNMTYRQISAKTGMPYQTVAFHARRKIS